MDFGLEAGEQRTHRIHLRRLRVQLRHETTLLRHGRQGDFDGVQLRLIELRLRRASHVVGDGNGIQVVLYETLRYMFPYDQSAHPVESSKTAPYGVVNHWREALGLEGTGGRMYWQQVGNLLPDELAFQGRSHADARDVVNAALSRPLKGGLTLEVGYQGRFSHTLLIQTDIGGVNWDFKDPGTGMTLAGTEQAMRNVFLQLSNNNINAASAVSRQVAANPSLVPSNPFTEKYFGGLQNLFFQGLEKVGRVVPTQADAAGGWLAVGWRAVK